eukprot:COSAG06_NODE_23790_length_681_cov_1.238832_2_plen_75_part_00
MACVLRVCFACVLFQGMDRYEANPSVKAVWDAADDYLMSQYGFSIIDIVRRNPKELTVHFGTEKQRLLLRTFLY